MSVKFNLSFAACLLLTGLTLAGCSSSDPLDRAIAEGTVTVDGTPLAIGDITFVDDDPSVQSDNVKVVDGAFSGPVIPGTKKVQIRGYEVVSANVPADSPEAGTTFKKQILPARFNDQTELTETIPSSGPLSYSLTTQ
ncbi:hypothetical protein Pla52o_52930 [Novipirellula galeiformis]|uniref:Uncharacterized protein n=1 Tax=Novipirellula galeiformis TaxID=2528004 RepID=A0A5C6C001_9BACT|nr:hypothetical protein [Novipirellula galeiformis]TWU17287.1 hypothetical protein Pla52o_52930 [Novipirellula galeiformis]